MQEETKQKLVKLLTMLRKKGERGIRREEIPEALQKAVTVGIHNGLITRKVEKWKRWNGRSLYSTWLSATVKNTELTGADIETEKEVAQHKLATVKAVNDFRMMKGEFWAQAKNFPAAGTIKQRLKALPLGDVEALRVLWTKVWEYYGLGSDITQKVYDVTPVKPIDNNIAKPHVKGQNFLLDRGEFRQKIKKLVELGMITPQTQEYILGKINAVRPGDHNTLETLRDKVYTYYSVEDNDDLK